MFTRGGFLTQHVMRKDFDIFKIGVFSVTVDQDGDIATY